jgi:hypothetical protein
MPIPERELFIVLRELHAWLTFERTDEPLALKTALQALFTEAERATGQPLDAHERALVIADHQKEAANALRMRSGCSLQHAHMLVRSYANTIAGSLVPQALDEAQLETVRQICADPPSKSTDDSWVEG